MTIPLTAFRIAAIGPQDVTTDLLALEQVVSQLSKDFASRDIHTTFHHWSKLSPGLGRPQDYIDNHISWSDLDFVVGAMWKSFGSAGTEHECNLILDLYKIHKQPDLLFYFRQVDQGSLLTTDAKEQYRQVERFRESLRDSLLWKPYSTTEELVEDARSSLRDKIEGKLRLQAERDRLTGGFPPNRAISVEVVISTRLPNGAQCPVAIALKNGRGEEFIIDTRFQSSQDIANWISDSMGFKATPGISIQDIIMEGARRALESGEKQFAMWYGHIAIEPHPQCKIDSTIIQTHKDITGEDGKPNIVFNNEMISIRHQRPRIIRDKDGKMCMTI